MDDLYEILGVKKDASDDEIKKAYRKIALKHHPDKGGSKEDEETFKKATAAYEVLGDKQKRQQYDQFGSAGFGGQGAGPGGFDFSNMNFNFGGQAGGFGDIFDSFFGGQAGARAKKGPQRGNDIEIVLSVNFEEAVFGTSKDVEVSRYETCSHCSGNGAEPGSEIKECTDCSGTGQQVKMQQTILGAIQTAVTCKTCSGRGKKAEKDCKTCSGEGREVKPNKIKVKVPEGINDKAVLRLKDQGEAGSQGGPYGDLFVHISVEPSKEFERVGDDIYTKQTIHVLQAILGDEIEVKTIHGNVKLKIPAGTESHKVFKITGKGVQKVGGSGKGDHKVKIVLEMPKKLSKAEKKHYAELAKEAKLDIDLPKGLFG